MGVTDNELNWRRVFPGPTIDVSGWTLANRMKLPDWCFGNRRVIALQAFAAGVTTLHWNIHTLSLYDPVCIWEVLLAPVFNDNTANAIRFGLAAVLPTNVAEMDASTPVLPDFGNIAFTPPKISLSITTMYPIRFVLRKGMATGGLYLTTEGYSAAVRVSVMVALIISELPTEVPAFLDPQLT